MRSFRRWLLLALLCSPLLACAAAPDDAKAFDDWVAVHPVRDFETDLHDAGLAGVLPTRQLVRTATDWRACGGPQFEVPPRDHWPAVRQVLALVAELKKRGILKDVESASGYRNPKLNACAHGAPRSAHATGFAVDLTGEPGQIDVDGLCRFWRDEGRAWKMGLSRYPSGRIHLDTSGWRTWGEDHTRHTSFCLKHLQH
jgi:hypothetical protein